MSETQKTNLSIPDVVESLVGFRVWRLRDDDLSLWSVTRGNPKKVDKKQLLLSNTTPDGYWPKQNHPNGWSVLEASCARQEKPDNNHFPPDSDCTCGIYATYDVNVIANYIQSAPVLGLVQGYGTVIPGLEDDETIGGFRSEKAKIVALLAISEDFTVPHRTLRKVAKEYNIPLVVPWSIHASEYAEAIRNGTISELGI